MLSRPSVYLRSTAPFVLAALATLAAHGVTGCVTEAKPSVEKCSTTAESVTFAVAGSCGPPGQITVSTTPGLCSLEIENGPNLGLPERGEFSGAAAATSYLIADGDWSLDGVSSDPAADPSTTQCSATKATNGGLLVTCNVNSCVASGDDTGFTCTPSTCVMHLTIPEPDAGVKDSGTMDSGAKDSGAKDSGPKDSGSHDSGKADTGAKDSGSHDAHAG